MIAGGIFRQDNPYNTVMNRIGDIAMLSVAWFVCCLPVVTIGVSTAAACEVAREMQEDRDNGIFKGFWRAIKRRFGTGMLLTLFLGVLIALGATMKPFIALVVAAIYALPIVLLATLPSAVMWVPLVWCIFGGGASAWAQMWLIRRAFDLQPQD